MENLGILWVLYSPLSHEPREIFHLILEVLFLSKIFVIILKMTQLIHFKSNKIFNIIFDG